MFRKHLQDFVALLLTVLTISISIGSYEAKQHIDHPRVSRYAMAEKRGLMKGHGMTLPSKDSVYYVYVSAGTPAFHQSVIDAINDWSIRSDIPFRSTNNEKKANIIVTQKKGKVDKDESKDVATLGVTAIADGTLAKRSHIYISKLACYECEVHASQVVEHEIGHALGLNHVARKDTHDLMNPIVTNSARLSQKDIEHANNNYKAVKALN